MSGDELLMRLVNVSESEIEMTWLLLGAGLYAGFL